MARLFLFGLLLVYPLAAQQNHGYYRYPAIHGQTIVFTAEGDLWETTTAGGTARRLTTSSGEETAAAIAPDGQTLAFTANYEGPAEVYSMPLAGGLPNRRTFEGEGAAAVVVGWTPDGRILYTTSRYSGIPDRKLAALDQSNRAELVPLQQAAQGVYAADGKTLFFTRLPFQGSQAKRYKGGTAQHIWKYTPGREAVALTADYAGTSKNAMWWKGRVYFLTDRDGTMNVWSMEENGKGLRQHTRHQGWDIQSASLADGKIVYQLGADLWLYDIEANKDAALDIALASDYDQMRERWVKQPAQYETSAHLSEDGKSLILTARGKVFVAPVKQGRLVEATAGKTARYRDARSMPDGKSLLTLSSETGEMEFWKLPANGVGPGEQLTSGGTVLRWNGVPSPDGKWVAHQDKDNQLWLLEVASKQEKKLDVGESDGNSSPVFDDIRWSSDSRWILWAKSAPNLFSQVWLYEVASGKLTALTTDRYNSNNAVWSADGKWIYFTSDRALRTAVFAPWGTRQPDPSYDKTYKVYQLALKKGERSPFEPPDELHPDKAADKEKDKEKPKDEKAGGQTKDEAKPKVEIELEGIAGRITEVPAPAGNYRALAATEKRLCWINADRSEPDKSDLQCLDIANKGDKPETVAEGVRGLELSGDGNKMLLRRKDDYLVADATVKDLKTPKAIGEAKVDLKDWSFAVTPRDEFREMFLDAWRMHRDYFYDRHMHGIDWTAMKAKYQPLVDRVRSRTELSDLLAQMVSELSALHTFVFGGDTRKPSDEVQLATLGATLERDQTAGGYQVRHVYQTDPDRPDKESPLRAPGVEVGDGDVITEVNGRPALSVAEIGELLRTQAGKQVLLRVKPKGKTETRDVVVKPVSMQADADLRYDEWEYTRRLRVEREAGGQIGYVHLRAMGPRDMDQWAEQFYPVFDRAGLIIDVRHNRGGNIDSWLLGKLLRKAWFYWQPREGKPLWNMQYAFRGHMVVLCDEFTASDGEAFAEGFKRLGLGKVIGTRTWGGEIWLSSGNRLADQGIATAAEMGVYGPDGKWLIEGHGVEPDMVVDNLPNETFNGKDAQLEAAMAYLKGEIKEKPAPVPAHPAYPDKSATK